MTKKIVVTGGAGFIGSNLVSELIKRNYEVSVIDDLSTGLISNLNLSQITFHPVSICDTKAIKEKLKGAEIIFHLAARGSVPRSISDPYSTFLVNTSGTINILEYARVSGAHVVFSSSSSVYGRNTKLPKDENMWLGPLSPYAASKLSSEAFVESYGNSFDFPTTILRFFNVFGPKQRPDHEYAAVIPKWIWSALNSVPIDLHGDGEQTRDFTYVETVVDVLVATVEKKLKYPGPINLAYGNKISLNSVINLLKTEFPDLLVNHKSSRNGDVKDSQNLPRLLNSIYPGIKPVSFEAAFQKTIEWIKSIRISTFNDGIAKS